MNLPKFLTRKVFFRRKPEPKPAKPPERARATLLGFEAGLIVESKRKEPSLFRCCLDELTRISKMRNYRAGMYALTQLEPRLLLLPPHARRVAYEFRRAVISRITLRTVAMTRRLYEVQSISIEEANKRLRELKKFAHDPKTDEAVELAIHKMQCWRRTTGEVELLTDSEEQYSKLIMEQVK